MHNSKNVKIIWILILSLLLVNLTIPVSASIGTEISLVSNQMDSDKTEIILPRNHVYTSDSSYNWGTMGCSSSRVADCIKDVPANDYKSIGRFSMSWGEMRFDIGEIVNLLPYYAEIDYVKVYTRSQKLWGFGFYKQSIKINGSVYYGGTQYAQSRVWITTYTQWNDNPDTNQNWKLNDLGNIQEIGFKMIGAAFVSMIYLEIGWSDKEVFLTNGDFEYKWDAWSHNSFDSILFQSHRGNYSVKIDENGYILQSNLFLDSDIYYLQAYVITSIYTSLTVLFKYSDLSTSLSYFSGNPFDWKLSTAFPNGGKTITEIMVWSDYNGQLIDDIIFVDSLERDVTSPKLNDFGVDDSGTGSSQFWAIATDEKSPVTKVTISLNDTLFDMNLNASGFWVYQPPSMNFNDFYTYQIVNISDREGNFIITPSIKKNITFNYDSLVPQVLDWRYDSSVGQYGTFRAKISETWGIVDIVIVNVTSCICVGASTAIMQLNDTEYISDMIEMDSGQISFVITVNDTAGNTFISSKHQGFVPIMNYIPIAENLTLTPDPLHSGDTLLLEYDFYDHDGDVESGTQIRWFKNGLLQPIYNDLTQVPTSALVKGDEWNTTVRPKDGQEFGEFYNTSTIIVQNTAPQTTNVEISPSYPTTNSTLRIQYSYLDYDNDLESFASRYIRWFKNDGEQTSLENQTSISNIFTSKGERWHFILKVFDGVEYSKWYNASPVVISNSLPVASNLTITTNPTTTDDLIASWNYNDIDGDAESANWLIRWYKEGILQSSLNNSSIVPSNFTSKDEQWYYTLQVFDGTDYSVLYTSTITTIVNTAPTASNITITSNPTITDDLIASWNYNDIDGDAESANWLIRWYKDEVLQPVYENLTTVSSNATVTGEIWYYTLQVFDGKNYSIIYTSSSVTILN
ncbi:MAG: hypothetical protein ACXAC2_12390 [Candidatus Kariarchaeaceae archaeon]|jgi:hypothetical protein